MKHLSIKALGAALLLSTSVFMAGQARATLLSVDFAQTRDNATSLSYDLTGGWSVVVTPGFAGGKAPQGFPTIQGYQWNGGGGIGEFSGAGNAHTLDNSAGSEFLKLRFFQNGVAQQVRVTSVTVDCVGCDFANKGADASWRVGGQKGPWFNEYAKLGVGDVHTYDLSNSSFGRSFLFGTSRDNLDGLVDSFKLESLTFEALGVPEPATVFMLGLGMLALFATRRLTARPPAAV